MVSEAIGTVLPAMPATLSTQATVMVHAATGPTPEGETTEEALANP
jgi:hypothetical protein